MSDFRVEVWPAAGEDNAVAQYRLFMPAQALMAQGADVSVTRRGPTALWDKKWEPDEDGQAPDTARLMGLAKAPDADVVVIQRPARRWWSDIIPHVQAAGVKVVVDIDDNFAHIDEGNATKQMYDPRFNPASNREWINTACRQADLVTCTTPTLLKRYGHGHGVIIPNYVPESYFKVFGYGPTTMGWSGSVATHPKDLQVPGGAVQDVLTASGWQFRVVGTGKGVKEALSLSGEPGSSGWVAFGEYPLELARLKVGIVPLADTAFNRAKSGLKVSEMNAVGVASVASPTDENVRLSKLGIGLIAQNPQQWRKRLRALVMNSEYLADVAGRGREAMRPLTYERHCGEWWDAWGSTIETGTRREAGIARLDRLAQIAAG